MFILAGPQPTAGGDSSVIGRGSRRGGGRILPEQMTILRTRPTTIQSKKGMHNFHKYMTLNVCLDNHHTFLFSVKGI